MGTRAARAQWSGWEAAVGVGAASNNRELASPVAAVGEVTRGIFHGNNWDLRAAASAGYFGVLQTGERVCVQAFGVCDLRIFWGFAATTLAGEVRGAHLPGRPHFRIGAGPWWGHDGGAMAGQSSSETGLLLTMEVAAQLTRRVTLGIEQRRIEGTRFGTVPLTDLIGRLRF